MKKATSDYLGEICDNIEKMLSQASAKDRYDAAVIICEHAAVVGIDESGFSKDLFAPLKIFKEAESNVINMIDREFLDMVGRECQKEAKKRDKKELNK